LIDLDQARLAQAAVVRRQADELLCVLNADRAAFEQRLTESGRRDPIKSVTGRSSLDAAILQTREMMKHMDDLLATMNHDLRAIEADPAGALAALETAAAR